MFEKILKDIFIDLGEVLSQEQMVVVKKILNKHFLCLSQGSQDNGNKGSLLSNFISAKRIEGCSEKSLKYYESTIRNMLERVNKPEQFISTEELRAYLDDYQQRCQISKVTLDNVRRILSSFFS